MPEIEELQTTAKAAAPGWSYVVDTGYDPSKVAINPTSRKRQRTGPVEAASDLSLRQQTAIQRHLIELDRDNHRSDAITVPKSNTKAQTTNVRKILASGKNFQHYVTIEEALAQQQANTAADAPAEPPRANKTPIARRKSLLVREVSSSESSPVPGTPVSLTRAPSTGGAAVLAPPKDISRISILDSTQPPAISEAELEALLSAPALPYNAVKSAPPPASAPRQRVFCEICGYWGRAKCMKCGARVCGVECRATHDESRCLKFYA